MNKYLTELKNSTSSKIVASDMILTKDFATTAGSKMLDGYKSLVESEVVTKLKDAGYDLVAKTNVGEFGFDVIGESSHFGACEKEGNLFSASCLAVLDDGVTASIDLDVNGAPRRASAQTNLTCIKPTYGTVSRYGTIPVACSGETVTVTAKNSDTCQKILSVISGYDPKDGTSIPEDMIKSARDSYSKEIKKVGLIKSFVDLTGEEEKKVLDSVCQTLKNAGVIVDIIDDNTLTLSRVAWNVLMSAELCNNVSRYDGVKFGYRTQNFTNLDELYVNSRTEAFGPLLKKAILFGSETLSTENYMKIYDKALRTRRVIVEKLNELLTACDLLLTPACSKRVYTVQELKSEPTLAFKENLFTAPASISGLPAIITSGVQFMAKSFDEQKLFAVATILEKEGK